MFDRWMTTIFLSMIDIFGVHAIAWVTEVQEGKWSLYFVGGIVLCLMFLWRHPEARPWK